MGLRYRKVIHITSWLRVNVTEDGLSVSVGPMGTSINFNKDGEVLNIALPAGFRYEHWLGHRDS